MGAHQLPELWGHPPTLTRESTMTLGSDGVFWNSLGLYEGSTGHRRAARQGRVKAGTARTHRLQAAYASLCPVPLFASLRTQTSSLPGSLSERAESGPPPLSDSIVRACLPLQE